MMSDPFFPEIRDWAFGHMEEVFSLPSPAIDIVPLTGDASNRRYYRLRATERPVSAILMVRGVTEGFKASEETTGREEQRPPGDPFLLIGKLLSGAGLPVPRILAQKDDGSWLLQEDLGDESLFSYLAKNPGEEESLSFLILDLLLAFGSRTIPAKSAWLATRKYSRELLYWEYQHFLEYGASFPDREAHDRLGCLFELEATDLAGRMPLIPVHRDFHSRNIMITGYGPVLIDFQDMLMGSPLYDLASWLFDAYRTMPEELLDRLVSSHYRRGREIGILPQALRPEEHKNLLARMALQRNLKACGRFFYIRDVKGNPSYMDAVGGTHRNMIRLARWEPSVAPLVESLIPCLKDPGL